MKLLLIKWISSISLCFFLLPLVEVVKIKLFNRKPPRLVSRVLLKKCYANTH